MLCPHGVARRQQPGSAFRSCFDSSKARQTVRQGRFQGLEFAPVFVARQPLAAGARSPYLALYLPLSTLDPDWVRPLATELELSDFLKSVEKRAFKRAVWQVRDDDAALDIVQDSMPFPISSNLFNSLNLSFFTFSISSC